ncbi:MAG TPA: 2'-5' RNA ligase family protein [Methanoregula sp.]|nr:2'-5' RNA ligase family protein [Methanoregula sp.]
MDDIYLIEIRLSRTKWRIRETISTIGRLFSLGGYLECHPHITLFGPLTLNEGISSRQLIDGVGMVAARFDPFHFIIDGWEMRKGSHGSVIAFSVMPSGPLKTLTALLAETLSPIVHSENIWDANPDSKWFHVTIANRLDFGRATKVFDALTGRQQGENSPGVFRWLRHLLGYIIRWKKAHPIRPVTIDETGIRITIIQGDTILAEYDLLEKRWINGDYSHDSKSWQTTLALFRQQSGFERLDPQPSNPDDIYLISDLHLGHANIIRYCSRPFLVSDAREMDHVLIKNWNYTISPANRVYYLGDLRYGPEALPALEYRKKLKGRITFIEGNHDDCELGAVHSATLNYRGFCFLLVHDPADAPEAFDGWVIHGHHHNNHLLSYPFIDFMHRRINVSAEVLGYIPVNLNDICSLLLDKISCEDTKPILLNYSYGVE